MVFEYIEELLVIILDDIKRDEANGIFTHTQKNGCYITIFSKHHKFTVKLTSSYLGCTYSLRQPLPGETWTRGGDLSDGTASIETWNMIVADIMRTIVMYETKKSKKTETVTLSDGSIVKMVNHGLARIYPDGLSEVHASDTMVFLLNPYDTGEDFEKVKYLWTSQKLNSK